METDENGWKVGCLYRDPEHVEGAHPIERDEVSWHHLSPPAPLPDRTYQGDGE